MSKGSKKHGLENYQKPDMYGAWLGYKISKIDRKKWEAGATLLLREDHLSPAGRVHGGVVAGFFDTLCGAAVFATMDPYDFASTVELKVNYFRPLDVGQKLVGKSKVVFRGKRLCVVQGFLHRAGEKGPVAMATGTYNIVPQKR